MTDSSQPPAPDRPEDADTDQADTDQTDTGQVDIDQAASDRRTVIVGRTTPRSQELRVSADEAVNPFPGPWKVKALVQDREADSLPQLQAEPPELSVVQGEQAQAAVAEAPDAEAPDAESLEAEAAEGEQGKDDRSSGGDSPQLRLL